MTSTVFKPCLIDLLAFAAHESAESVEMAQYEYEVEVYLKGFDIEQIKAMADSYCSQEQWGAFIPKTDANAAQGNLRVRMNTYPEGHEDDLSVRKEYIFTTKTEAGDKGKLEHEIPTDAEQFEMFKQLADQGLIKVRYLVPGELEGGVTFKYELDVFYTPTGELVPWVKIDCEFAEGTVFNPENVPFTHEEMIFITPELKGSNPNLAKRVGELYRDFFTSKNAYL